MPRFRRCFSPGEIYVRFWETVRASFERPIQASGQTAVHVLVLCELPHLLLRNSNRFIDPGRAGRADGQWCSPSELNQMRSVNYIIQHHPTVVGR